MARGPRRTSPADIYHVIVRGAGRQLIFEDDGDRLLFLRLLNKYLRELGGEAYAWTLMSDHVHAVLHMRLNAIAKLLQKLRATYCRNFNDKTEHTGPVIERRFISEPIDTDEYLMTCIRYVHQNIEKAGVCKMEEYVWSSYGAYVGNTSSRLSLETRLEFPLAVFGGLESFLLFHSARDYAVSCVDVGKTAHRMTDDEAAVYAKSLVGDDTFRHMKEFEIRERNPLLSKFKGTGISSRQLARLTGIGASAIKRAWASSQPDH